MRNSYECKGDRFLRPNSESKIPGVVLLTGTDGIIRAYSHGNDVLNDGKTHDAFDVFCLLEYGGDVSKALDFFKNANSGENKTSSTSDTTSTGAASRNEKATLKPTQSPNKAESDALNTQKKPKKR